MPQRLIGQAAILSLLVQSLACGDGQTGPNPGGPGDGPTGSVAEALTVDLAQSPEYATVSWPVEFDAAVRATVNDPPANPVTNRGALLDGCCSTTGG